MKAAIIGDVHGHSTQLLAAIEHAETRGVDRIILLGDLIDRGPSSLACLRIAQTWTFRARTGRHRKLEVISGNHEDAYVRIADGLPKPGRDKVSLPESRPFYNRLRSSDLEWMHGLPYYIRIKELNVVCLHGGVTPYQFDLDDADAWVLRTRYLSDEGCALRSTVSSSWFWADSYNGRFGTIVFGHEGHTVPTRYDHAIALDGEGFGRLHGVVLSDEPGDKSEDSFTIAYGLRKVVRHKRLSKKPMRVHGRWVQEAHERWAQKMRQRSLWEKNA